MITNSLRFRLLGSACIVILIALQVVAAALLVLYERNIVRQLDRELNAYIEQLAANVVRTDGGSLELPIELAEPRFRQPFAGRYWQMTSGQVKLRSRSLWETELAFAGVPEPQQGVKYGKILGPDRQIVYAGARSILLETDSPDHGYTRIDLIAAMDAEEIETLKQQFFGDVLTALGLLATLLMVAAWIQVSVGLQPFEVLRTGLENIRLGNQRRLAGAVPVELEPLVAETNRLLDAQERAIQKARSRAGDLAHGVKTPLTALTILSQQLRDEGKCETSWEIDHHLKGIATHVERELARARMAAGSGVAHRTRIEPVVSRLVRTMQTLPRGDDIDWRIECEPGLVTSIDETDLVEALGNLMDNARKWARSVVTVAGCLTSEAIEMTVADDGPGVPSSDHTRILRRGVRLDETKPGSGLGLSIVREIAENYGGTITLLQDHDQGLCVHLTLPGLPSSGEPSPVA